MDDFVIPIPAPTACRCSATDGQCHGWEGGSWWPQPFETPTTIMLKLGTTIEWAQEGE